MDNFIANWQVTADGFACAHEEVRPAACKNKDQPPATEAKSSATSGDPVLKCLIHTRSIIGPLIPVIFQVSLNRRQLFPK